MKKIIFVVITTILLLIGSIETVRTQDTFWGFAEKIVIRNSSDTAWAVIPIEPTIVYVDWGFQFVAIGNDRDDRFFLIKYLKKTTLPCSYILHYDAVDDKGTLCQVLVTWGTKPKLIITVLYTNIQYMYTIETYKDGYPIFLFKKGENV